MRTYHRTARATDTVVEGLGFVDQTGPDSAWGVFLSDVPLDINEGAIGDTVLAVDIDEAAIAPYEWVEDVPGKWHREWWVPAEVLNACAIVSPLTDEELDQL